MHYFLELNFSSHAKQQFDSNWATHSYFRSRGSQHGNKNFQLSTHSSVKEVLIKERSVMIKSRQIAASKTTFLFSTQILPLWQGKVVEVYI